ncbi:MAG TPA: ferredoxin [Acidimicrobiales bacterium]|nr:ferredoxin [Acidimicrobiales bacterium]
MRVVVDYDLCQGHAVCVSEAPEVFEVPKGGQVRLRVPEIADGQRAQAEMAVRYCPTGALTLEED